MVTPKSFFDMVFLEICLFDTIEPRSTKNPQNARENTIITEIFWHAKNCWFSTTNNDVKIQKGRITRSVIVLSPFKSSYEQNCCCRKWISDFRKRGPARSAAFVSSLPPKKGPQQVKTFCFEIQKIFVDWYMDEGSLNGLCGFAEIELRIANWKWDKN